MRWTSGVFFLVLVAAFGFADDRPAIYSLLNKPITLADGFSVQSITLIKESGNYYILRTFFGSGLPFTGSVKYRTEFDSEYQVRFSIPVEAKGRDPRQFRQEEFVLSIMERDEIRLLLNGIQVVIHMNEDVFQVEILYSEPRRSL